MRYVIAAALLTFLYATPAAAQPVALPLPVTVVSVELEGCAEVMQSSASCPLPPPAPGFGSGIIIGSAVLSNPNGRVELSISGSAEVTSASRLVVWGNVLILTLEIAVPVNAERVAMEVMVSAPPPTGTDSLEAIVFASSGVAGTSAVFGDGFHIDPGILIRAADPEPQVFQRRVVVLPELTPGDTVRLPMAYRLMVDVPPGNTVTFNETSILEFKYVPAPEPPAESGLGAAVAFLLALGAWRRRPR